MKRTLWHTNFHHYADSEDITPITESDEENHNLIGSLIEDTDNLHSPVLDIDFPARLVPSTTPGHFHLYLDGLALHWSAYIDLLVALGRAGVLGEGYVNASIDRGMTTVRPPHVKKDVAR